MYWITSSCGGPLGVNRILLFHANDKLLTFVFFCLEKARLCLFGSSKNGFGFRDSDLDICMTLEGHENAEVRVSEWKGMWEFIFFQ